MQYSIHYSVKPFRALADWLYKHCCLHRLCQWQWTHWSVQGLIVTSSAERWKTTEEISGLLSSGRTTSIASSAVMPWRKGLASKSAQVRYPPVGGKSLLMLFLLKLLTNLDRFDVSRKATHLAGGESVLTALPTCKKNEQPYIQYLKSQLISQLILELHYISAESCVFAITSERLRWAARLKLWAWCHTSCSWNYITEPIYSHWLENWSTQLSHQLSAIGHSHQRIIRISCFF